MNTTATEPTREPEPGDEFEPQPQNTRETRADALAAAARKQFVRAMVVVTAMTESVEALSKDGEMGGAIVRAFARGDRLDPSQLTDDVQPGVRVIYAELDAFAQLLDDLAQLGAIVDYVLADVPRGLDDIAAQLLTALAEYERVAGKVKAAAVEWGDAVLLGPSAKADALAQLMHPTDGSAALSRTAAEKAVTAHPVYAEYREQVDALLRVKYDRETDAATARLRVETLREVSAAMRESHVANNSAKRDGVFEFAEWLEKESEKAGGGGGLWIARARTFLSWMKS